MPSHSLLPADPAAPPEASHAQECGKNLATATVARIHSAGTRAIFVSGKPQWAAGSRGIRFTNSVKFMNISREGDLAAVFAGAVFHVR